MTISSSTSKNQYVSSGGAAYTYTFKIFDDADIRAIVTDTSGTDTEPSFTVSGVGDDAGGTVTFNTAVTSGYTVTLKRNEPLTQSIDYVEGDDFPADAHEEGLDRSVIRDQFLQEQLSRAALLPENTSSSLTMKEPSGEGNKYLTLNAGATQIEYSSTVISSELGTLTISGGDAGKVITVTSSEDNIEVNDHLALGSSETVFNEAGADRDFRVESDTLTHAFIIDGATGKASFGDTSIASTDADLSVYKTNNTVWDATATDYDGSTSLVLQNLSTTVGSAVGLYFANRPSSAANGAIVQSLTGSSAADLNYIVEGGDHKFSGGEVQAAAGLTSWGDNIYGNETYTAYATRSTHTTVIPLDDTIPQNTEGEEIITAAITPKSASSTLEIEFSVNFSLSGTSTGVAAIFVDSTADALFACAERVNNAASLETLTGKFQVASGSTSARTYKLRAGASSGSIYINGNTGRLFGGVMSSYLKVREI